MTTDKERLDMVAAVLGPGKHKQFVIGREIRYDRDGEAVADWAITQLAQGITLEPMAQGIGPTFEDALVSFKGKLEEDARHARWARARRIEQLKSELAELEGA